MFSCYGCGLYSLGRASFCIPEHVPGQVTCSGFGM